MKTHHSKITNFKRLIHIGSFIVILLGFGIIFGLKIWIKADANQLAEAAVEVFQKDKTQSLLALIEAQEYSLIEKNKAVWALGILKAEDALPKLQSMYTGEKCRHETTLCQRELKKAIEKMN